MNSTPSNPSRRIDRFVEEHRYLSNFFLCDVRDDAGNLYASVEHAYQAAKARTETERLHIASAPTAKKAKHRGSKVPTDSAWEARRLDVMRSLLVKKFAPGSELAAKLLSTEDAELVEGNIWGDRFWGVHEGLGENHLGRLLMDIRIQLRESAGGQSHGCSFIPRN